MWLTFQLMTLEKYLTKNFDIFFRGYPLLAPRSAASPKMTTPALPMTPLFNCRILLYSKIVDVFQTSRYQYVKLWSRYEGFQLEKKQQNFPFFPPANKKYRKSVNFQDFLNFSTRSAITPLFYMWINIDTSGYKKSKKA